MPGEGNNSSNYEYKLTYEFLVMQYVLKRHVQ